MMDGVQPGDPDKIAEVFLELFDEDRNFGSFFHFDKTEGIDVIIH